MRIVRANINESLSDVSLWGAAKVATSLGLHSCTTGSHLKGNAMKKLFIQAIYYVLLAALVWAAMTGNSSLLNIAALAFWVIILLGLFGSIVELLIAFGIEYGRDEKDHNETIANLEKFAQKKGFITRAWGWICLVVGSSFLAFGGWVFTAVSYVLVSLFCYLCMAVIRERIAKYKAKVSPGI